MSNSENILLEMREIKIKKERMQDYVTQLNTKHISSKHVREDRDTTKMSGKKYDEQHEATKTIITTCVDKVKAEKEHAVHELNKKIMAYDVKLLTLGANYGLAVLAEEAEKSKNKEK
ncbi:hypothetical protein [Isobaculum melis]|uniref:Uncharacterized protein n=1 Tax=Isobaculum melis TaxID=142588 RepID=A0A1H9UJD3_9LACT|nr:hypothetical protein [Isobaculum melis]SES09472.1 hypothetical protein SAMN04488559_13310 [Isobaculum melis]